MLIRNVLIRVGCGANLRLYTRLLRFTIMSHEVEYEVE